MKYVQAGAALLALGAMAGANALEIENGSFETGDFSGWTVATEGPGSDAYVALSTVDIAPGSTDGLYYSLLTADASVAQYLSWSAGDTLSFDWYFEAMDELPFNDYAEFVLIDDMGNELDSVTFADADSVGDYGVSGWNSFSYTFSDNNSGWLSLGVFNDVDEFSSSSVYLDNITATSSSVPAPTSMLLSALGLIFVGLRSRRK